MDSKLKQKLLKYERKIFELVGLDPDEYYQSNDEDQAIHYLKFGDPSNPAVLLIHGYGGSAITFFRVIPELMNHFYVIAIDLLGFGASDRPEFTFDNFEKTLKFFTDSLINVLDYLKIENVIVVGHSLGGFISAHLSALLKDKVTALFLVGAAGYTEKNFTDAEFEVMFGKISKWYDVPTELVQVFDYLTFKKKFPVFNFLSNDVKSNFVSAYFETAAFYLTREERELFVKYYTVVHKLGSDAHNSLWSLLKYGSYSDYPIIKVLAENPELVSFTYYGEEEWLDIEHVRIELTKQGMEKKYRILTNCGHQVFFQNPTEFLQHFYKDYRSILKDIDK